MYISSRDESDTVRLVMFRPYLRKDLGEAHTDRDGDTELFFYRLLHLFGDHGVRAMETSPEAGEVHKRLVYGVFLNVRRKTPENPEHPHRKQAVCLIIRGDNDRIRADLPDLEEPHAPLHAARLCLITGSSHNAPLLPCYDRSSPEFRVHSLFAGSKEGVGINVEDGLGPGPDSQGLGGHKIFVGAGPRACPVICNRPFFIADIS